VGRPGIFLIQKDCTQTDAADAPARLAAGAGFQQGNQHGPNSGTGRYSIKQKETQLAAVGSLHSRPRLGNAACNPLIRICVWWTTIAISAVAAWFEWQYRRGRRQHAGEQTSTESGAKEPESQKPAGAGQAVPLKPVEGTSQAGEEADLPKKTRKREKARTLAGM
jgi:hypothetical protein